MRDPLWKRAYDAAEEQAGPALTKLLANPDVIEAIKLATAVRKRASDDLGRFIRNNLHSVNLPSGTDVQKVSNQIAAVERQIRLLDRRLDELQKSQAELATAQATKSTAKKKATKNAKKSKDADNAE